MAKSKIEATGLNVHKKFKHMVISYGAMMLAIPAETLGQNQAEISLESVKKIGDIRENIALVVEKSDMTQPTNSCGQASNEVCELLLGISGASKFEEENYELLSGDGANLKSSLSNKNVLIRLEVDRFNAPSTYRKAKKEEFNPKKAEINTVYLLEDQLLFPDEFGTIIDLEQPPEKCKELFDTIHSPYYYHYALKDDLITPKDGVEEAAVCEIGELFRTKERSLELWRATHSFTIFVAQSEENTPNTLYPYQAYWTKHTLQSWFSGDKDETLSRLGTDNYIEKLALLAATENSDIRSNIYAQLFSPPGRENIFCGGMNKKTSPLRVKFKIAEVNPELALENLQSVQDFIDKNYPGNEVESQCDLYKTKAETAMTQQLEKQLMFPNKKDEPVTLTGSISSKTLEKTTRHTLDGRSKHSLFTPMSSIDQAISSVISKDNLKILAKQADSLSKEDREKLVVFFKTLSQEQLNEIRHESNTASKAWDEQYGLIFHK